MQERALCVIDPGTRKIAVHRDYLFLGIESDEKAKRVWFSCPKIVGDDIDLSELNLYVNYQNGGREKNSYLVDDVSVDGDNIIFSWLLSRQVTKYKGTVRYIVCAKQSNGEDTTNEWNTQVAEGSVDEGLEAVEEIEANNIDAIEQILARIDDINTDISADLPYDDIAANTEARHTHANKDFLDGLDASDFPIDDINSNTEARHTHSNKEFLDGLDASDFHTHANKDFLDGLDESVFQIDVPYDAINSNTEARHTHANKEFLDGLDASDFHSHANKDFLDGLDASDFHSHTNSNVLNLLSASENGILYDNSLLKKSTKIEQPTATTICIEQGIEYRFGVVEELDITFAPEIAGYVNEYSFSFISGSAPTSLILPETVIWANELTIEAHKKYQISIEDNIALWDAVDYEVTT